MKKINVKAIIAAAAVAALPASCTDALRMQDHSFRFAASAAFDAARGRNILVLDREGGGPGEYTATYRFDSSDDVVLLGPEGSPFLSGSTFTVGEDGRAVFPIRGIRRGDHVLEMDISNGWFEQHLEAGIPVEREPFCFEAVVVTETSDRSVLMLTLTEGYDRKRYEGRVFLDGEECLTGDGPVEMDFSAMSTWTLPLPHVRPGDHTLSVRVSDGGKEESAEVTFSEPLRHDRLDLVLYRDEDGVYRMDIPSNPYGIRMEGRAVLKLAAKCAFCDDPPLITVRKRSVNDTTVLSLPRKAAAGLEVCRRDSVASVVKAMYEMDTRYTRVHVGGPDAGWEYKVTGYEKVYYHVDKEDFIMGLDWEDIPGVSLWVDNRIGPVIVNGRLDTGGRFKVERLAE